MQGRPYRSLLILLAVALLIIPAAVIFFNEQVSLTGTAIQQSISQSDSEEAAPSSEDSSSDEQEESSDEESSSQSEDNESNADDGESASDQTADSDEASADPTDDEADSKEPSADPTDDEAGDDEPAADPTDAESEDSSAEPTDDKVPAIEPTDDGTDADGSDEAEATEEAGDNSSGDKQPEATEEPSSEPTPAPETTEEPALEVTAEVTPEPEATAEPLALDVTLACGPGGVEFTVSNTGADMTSAESYRIDDTSSGEFQLAAGESATISAGFGTPLFSAAGISAQPEEPCLPPPALEVSAVCTAEAGARFVISNSGGPMLEAQAYTLDGEAAGEFQLSDGGTSTIEAGYGSPVFASGDLNAALEEACDPPGSIGGEVWLDVNGDGTRGEDEAAIAEVTITLTDSEGVTQETISTEDGRYGFIRLLPGDYTVEIKEAPVAARPSHDAEGEADSSANITVAFEAIRADFGYQPLGTISGLVWLDVNGDGTRSEDETGIADVAITLTYSESDTQETITAEDGSYSFGDLPYGDYGIQIASAPADALPAFEASVLISLNSEGVSANFGYLPVIKPAISGVVWADLNGDGLRDEGEPGLGNIPVMLTGTAVEAQTVTDASGTYEFVDLAAGEYGVALGNDVAGEYYSVTADAAATVLTLADEPIVDVNFGLQPARMGSISGLIWLETGDFGVRNSGETGIAGVVVDLLDSAGTVLQSVTLEADGRFTFIDLIPGTYSVRISEESLPDRLFVTYNPDGSSTFSTPVTLPPGVDVEDVEFGLVGAF